MGCGMFVYSYSTYCVSYPTITEIRRMAAYIVADFNGYSCIQKGSFFLPLLYCTVCTTIASLSILVPSQSVLSHIQHVPAMPSNGEGRETGSNNGRQFSDMLCVLQPMQTVYGWDHVFTCSDLQCAWRTYKNGQQNQHFFRSNKQPPSGTEVARRRCGGGRHLYYSTYLRFHSH
mmetsp:Transcript_18833/g.20270  ORF Transcript_18833/g.20270 Transcript_18833/m.20270 type:complete len:174 (-) Transcript_18833:132-653(-)